MKILAVNAGSSSLKFQLLEMPEEKVITSGLVERIGFEDAIFNIKVNGEKRSETISIPNHSVAVQMLLEVLVDLRIVKSLEEIVGIGHRVVHGGEKFADSVLITKEVFDEIVSLKDLAPLHNPANATGIKAFREVLPNVPQSAVFDTAFHQTMPKESFLYPTPYSWYTKYGVRRYGFHGTSHKYVSARCIELLNKPVEDTKIITVHIGNGGSLAAVLGGKSIDTSMGFTPLAGIMMGTRSGDIDPSILPYIMEKEDLNIGQAVNALNKDSGLKGVSGKSSDMRDIVSGVLNNDPVCIQTMNLFAKRVCDYIGSYFVELGGCDAIVFTAGIGENSEPARKAIISRLGALGITLDHEANKVMGEERLISTPDSKIKVFVIPTNEEVVIARDTVRLIKK
ncbi:MAG: acetate kinase [Haloplasmataceae bacterium]|jgi:acetate kinase|nr:acetate kinase [Haloplasmataceae bacterium]